MGKQSWSLNDFGITEISDYLLVGPKEKNVDSKNYVFIFSIFVALH